MHKSTKTRKTLDNKTKSFRISAKRIFLTYSQVAQELDPNQVLIQLSAKQNVDKYLIAEESHQDGGKHFHVLLESKTKFDIRDQAALNIAHQSDSYHGNYQEARNYKRIAKYIGKDSNYITNFPNYQNGEFLSVEEDLLRLTPMLGVKNTSKYYLKNYTTHALKGVSARNVETTLNHVNQLLSATESGQQGSVKVPFTLEDFKLTPELKQWIDQGCQPTLLLAGEGGTGKTAFTKALAAANGWTMLLCNHLEGLKGLTQDHDLIVFDDLTFKGIDDQQLLAIVGNDETRQVRVLHGAVEKPKGIKQVITLNTNVLRKLKPKIMHKQYLRRLLCVKLEEPLIVNLNVNIEVNHHTNIYNNSETIADNERLLNNL